MNDSVSSPPSALPAVSAVRLPDWLVRNRNFVLLWAGYGVAAVGDHLSEIALLKERGGMERPDATRVQALISFGFFLPFVLLGPFTGWWADRFNRKNTMILADLLRAAIVWNLAIITPWLAARLEPAGLGDFSIVLPLFVIGALAAFFSPARQSLLPTLIRDDQLVRANALISALGTIGTILSAVLGGYLVQHAGPSWNFHINGLTFVLSAIFVGLLNMRQARSAPHPPLEGVFAPIRAGFNYVWTHKRVLQMILLGMVFWAAAGAVISVVPAIVRVYFGSDYAAAGTFRGIMGVGLAVGAAVMSIVGPALPLQVAVGIAVGAAGLWLLLLDLAYILRLHQFVTGLCLFGIGGAGAALLVSIMATIQRLVPDSRRGRVCGVSDMCTMGAMVAATGLLGLPNIPNLDQYIPVLLLVTALGFVATFWLCLREYRRGSRLPPLSDFTWAMIGFVARFWWRVQRVGPCTLPRHGPAIVAANHNSGIDPLVLIGTSPHRLIGFLVEKDYYDLWLPRFFMRMADCVPIKRDRPLKDFFAGCLRLLNNGGALGVFPWGTIAAPGDPEPPAKEGLAAIALRTGAPIIPCHISGAQYHVNPLVSLFQRHRVRVRWGRAIDLSAFAGRERDRDALREVTELVMQRIRELGPEPVA